MIRHRKDFLHAKRGTAAVEFALLLPVMLVVLFGSLEATGLIIANRGGEKAAAALADVSSRFTAMSGQDICDVMTGAAAVSGAASPADLQLRLTSINIDSNAIARVEFSALQGSAFARQSQGTVITNDIPQNLRETSRSSPIMRAELRLTYRPTFVFLFAPSFTLRHVEYRRPRLVSQLPRTGTTSPCGA